MVKALSKESEAVNFRLLICGSGIAGRTVAQVAVNDGRASIVGLFDAVPSQLEKAQMLFPDAITSTIYEQILEQTRPDAVVVATPDHLHADHVLTALDHGCHVLLEKPLATNTADAQRMLAAASTTGLQVMVDHTMRYIHPWEAIAREAQVGRVGKIFFVQGDYVHDMSEQYWPHAKHHTPWRVDKQHPQNILLGGGCHPLDLMLWTVNAPVTEVYAYSNKLSMPEFPSDDCYILMLQFATGVMGKVLVTSGCSGHIPQEFLAVFGTEGTLFQGKLIRRGEKPITLEETGSGALVGGHGWGRSVIAFLDLLEGKTENPIPMQDGAKVVAVYEAALESIKTGRPQQPKQFSF